MSIVTPYVYLFILTALVSTLAAGIAWGRRNMPGAPALALVMVAITEWASAAAFEAAAVPLAEKVFWSKVEYLGGNATVLLWLLFVVRYTGHEGWLTRRRVGIALLVPVFNVLSALTNDWHGQLWTGFTPGPAGTNLIIYHHGPLYAVVALATFVLVLAGTVLLARAAVGPNALFRRQAWILLAASVAPWIGALLYSFELSPIPGLDLVPISFLVSGGILLWGLLRIQIFDLVPVARDALIERMSDGVMVVDAQGRIVDLNPAARGLLGITSYSIGMPASGLLEKWPAILTSCQDTDDCQSEIALDSDATRFVDLRISPFRDRRGAITGRLLVIRDVSQRKQAEEQVRMANQRLQEQLAEIIGLQAQLREEAIRDVLTTLFNRRYLEETLPRELSRAARDHYPLSLVILDMDDFKQLNDMYGHEAGDTLLKAIGPYLSGQIRIGDIACRYGGEEFVVVMPNTTADIARQRAEAWRAWMSGLTTMFRDAPLQGTLSAGVAVFPDHGQIASTLLRAADMALYAAKAAGRNRVVVWHEGLPAESPHTGVA